MSKVSILRLYNSEYFFGMLRKSLSVFFLLLFAATTNAEALAKPLTIVSVKNPEFKNNSEQLTEADIITLVLEKTKTDYGPYELRKIPPMNRARALSALSNNIYPNLVMMMSYDEEIMAQNPYNFINIPADFGADSYRICFVRQALKEKIASINSLEQLREYTFGAGIGWLDVKILKYNGFKVIEQNNVQNIIRMTKAGRIDLFCRGFSEVFSELKHQSETTGLPYDESFALYYPLPKFLFVHKNNTALFNRIREGLIRAEKDGSLKALWMDRNKASIAESHLKSRKIFHLTNPYMTNLSKEYERYLYDPQK